MAQCNFSCNRRRKGWGRVKSKKVSNEGEVVRRLSRSPSWRVGESMHCSCILCNQYAFQKNLGWELRRGLFKESSSFLWEKKKKSLKYSWVDKCILWMVILITKSYGGKIRMFAQKLKACGFPSFGSAAYLALFFFLFFNLSSSFWISAYLTFPIFIMTWKSFL